MGIPGLVQSLGPGERISLAKLAVDHLQRTSRPIRVAIDISIWLFQIQAGKGGTNPELRTLFYRLVRLTSLPVHPLFVYDGPQRPTYKRGKLIGRNTGVGDLGRVIRRSKYLIDLFRFPHHTAPGEAEAECARLQTSGVVDAVMSNDVDAIMFGSKVTIMNFSKENSSGTNAATHVTLYRTEGTGEEEKPNVPLDRGGMILFALLSGGDYLPAGVPKCGPKLAGEIVQAGFGNELLQAIEGSPSEVAIKLGKWRERLQNELHENGEGYFRSKHKAVQIPDNFPDLKVLRDYTHPVVSSLEKINEVRQSFKWDQAIDIEGLRNFVGKDFGWQRGSARRLTKILAAPLVCNRLRLCVPLLANLDSLPPNEPTKGAQFCGQRFHYSTDGLSELRLEFIPSDIVGLDLKYEPTATGTQQDSETEDIDNLETEDDVANPNPETRRQTSYDPTQKDRVWVFEAIAEIGMPEAVNIWNTRKQEKLAGVEKRAARKRAPRVTKPKVVDPKMKFGEIMKYGTIVKSRGTAVTNCRSFSSQKAAYRNDSTNTNENAFRLHSQFSELPSSQSYSSSYGDPLAPLKSSNETASTNTKAAWDFECSNESDLYDTSIETIGKSMFDMQISSNAQESSPTNRDLSPGVSHKAAGSRTITSVNPQIQIRNKSEGISNISQLIQNLDIKQENNATKLNTFTPSSRSSISDSDLSTAGDILSQISALKIQTHKGDKCSGPSHTTTKNGVTSPDNPPASAAADLPSNDDRKHLSSKTENGSQAANSPVQRSALSVIETYKGYWTYRQNTSEDDEYFSPEAPSNHHKGEGRNSRPKNTLDKKLGKMKLKGRVSILDLSEE
ncbi:Holliday junction resolvase YEN1 [Blastomyces parvus]|uniref:Holliday junction resolvase YEN1 n=1 Tax=Blastomyces parvus TaxID=2060905 RepID=A0A2B7XE49_9EURO|nr:Holliday junction resolvase YEN1 [Blastomyces parvus]